MAVENNLKNLRESMDYSQKGLACAIGVNEKTIRNIEVNGTCSLEVAMRLAEYFNRTVESIFTLHNDEIITEDSPKKLQAGRKRKF